MGPAEVRETELRHDGACRACQTDEQRTQEDSYWPHRLGWLCLHLDRREVQGCPAQDVPLLQIRASKGQTYAHRETPHLRGPRSRQGREPHRVQARAPPRQLETSISFFVFNRLRSLRGGEAKDTSQTNIQLPPQNNTSTKQQLGSLSLSLSLSFSLSLFLSPRSPRGVKQNERDVNVPFICYLFLRLIYFITTIVIFLPSFLPSQSICPTSLEILFQSVIYYSFFIILYLASHFLFSHSMG